jgi:hypothetical protein
MEKYHRLSDLNKYLSLTVLESGNSRSRALSLSLGFSFFKLVPS